MNVKTRGSDTIVCFPLIKDIRKNLKVRSNEHDNEGGSAMKKRICFVLLLVLVLSMFTVEAQAGTGHSHGIYVSYGSRTCKICKAKVGNHQVGCTGTHAYYSGDEECYLDTSCRYEYDFMHMCLYVYHTDGTSCHSHTLFYVRHGEHHSFPSHDTVICPCS